jgi:myo-inositol 2-dehydrogenase / D-chiro-inositol 1-dehydrogenase
MIRPQRSGSRPLPAPAAMMRGAVLGLVTHTVPHLRAFLPAIDNISVATTLEPFGYRVVLEGGNCTVELVALLLGRWSAHWTFQAWGGDQQLTVSFPPSYVQAGSSTATLSGKDGRRSWRLPFNGYQAEWMHLADVVQGRSELMIPVQTAVDDLVYALDLADRAVSLVQQQEAQLSEESA